MTLEISLFILLQANTNNKDVFAQQQLSSTLQQQSEQFVSKDRITSFTVISLKDGKRVTIANTTGDIILLNAWATWCLPCREEMPGLEQLHNEYNKNGLEIVGVSVDNVGMENNFITIPIFIKKYIQYYIW